MNADRMKQLRELAEDPNFHGFDNLTVLELLDENAALREQNETERQVGKVLSQESTDYRKRLEDTERMESDLRKSLKTERDQNARLLAMLEDVTKTFVQHGTINGTGIVDKIFNLLAEMRKEKKNG